MNNETWRTVALVGDEPLVAQCAEIARNHGLTVGLIATTNDIVREWAADLGIPVVRPGELGAGLSEHPAEVLLSIANLRVIRGDVLDLVDVAINFHDGPLPGYAGLNVTTWAILGGETEHAITWHSMTSNVDAGEIITTERFAIDDEESAFALNARCYEAALASFPRIAAGLAAGDLVTDPQPDGVHRMFKRHDRPARVFDPATPAAETVRIVRALDLGHRLRNSVGSLRVVLDGRPYVFEAASVATDPSGAAAGTVVAIDDALRIATSDGDVVVTAVSTATGIPVAVDELGLDVGEVVPSPAPELVASIAELEPKLSRDELFWIDRLVAHEPTAVPAGVSSHGAPSTAQLPTAGVSRSDVLAAIGLWLSRVSSAPTVSVAVSDERIDAVLAATAPLTREPTVVVDTSAATTFAELTAAVDAELANVQGRLPLLVDAIGRDPRTRGHEFAAGVMVRLGEAADEVADGRLTLYVGRDRITIAATIDPTDPAVLDRYAEQIATILAGGRDVPGAPLDELSMVGVSEAEALDAFNRTARDHDRAATIDRQFRAAVDATPDAPAVSSGNRTLTYRQLDAAAAALAARLTAVGVQRGDRVGLALERGIDMVVGVLAILEVGAAYLPLDPSYPTERLDFMVEDAGIRVLLATDAAAATLGRPGITVVDPASNVHSHKQIRTDLSDIACGNRGEGGHEPADLAYVIYTSGSTGKPKGVMLEHRQVVNFFAAMDDVIDRDPPGVWLAVTSLSFDISVLELLWTLTRGFHVVVKSDRGIPVADGASAITDNRPARPVSFSLFYFAAGEDAAADGYRLLLDSAKFADQHGFEAVWTPERHFHAFGGSYPNPSVTGAALAAITTNVGIRAGSVVLPLHSPIRVAEEWAVVDNISRGRVGISFAAGWQPNDFVLNPSAYATAREDLPQRIATVQKLWRGETVTLPGHNGADVDVHTLPRPTQGELPTWLTSAGSKSTFERAGMLGTNVLTHLLGQSVEQLAENVAAYRAAWHQAGHPGEGRVTLMLHTFLHEDSDTAREIAREPMKSYLGTAVGLLKDVASAFPTFAGRGKNTDDLFKSLTSEEMDQLLEVAAHRYLSTSGLFGTVDEAAAMVETVSAVGVDEVACLIDFGVPTDDALGSLELLLESKLLVDRRRAVEPGSDHVDPADDTVSALVAKHSVTHLQCTPSLAAMLVADPADRAALSRIQHLMLGGEALPAALAGEIRSLLPGRLTNMYGPTETTIWSLTQEIDGDGLAQWGSSIPIGKAIANTTVYVLDEAGRRVPVGVFGELHIGGEGVARGYHDRPELTAERFVDRPGMGRVYATGDVVRFNPAGYVEFAGRADNQVKIRGHRVELGEIEAVLDRHPDVVQSVVVAREERLVAYVVVHGGAGVSAEALRKHVGEVLPDVMVPAVVMPLQAFPLTPNGKIDRKALPATTGVVSADAQHVAAPPANDLEAVVAEVWASELERAVGREDNFFDIGGHSLLAVKVFRRLADTVSDEIILTDVFRYPTIRTFAAHLATLRAGAAAAAEPATAAAAASAGSDRGALRRRALARRGG